MPHPSPANRGQGPPSASLPQRPEREKPAFRRASSRLAHDSLVSGSVHRTGWASEQGSGSACPGSGSDSAAAPSGAARAAGSDSGLDFDCCSRDTPSMRHRQVGSAYLANGIVRRQVAHRLEDVVRFDNARTVRIAPPGDLFSVPRVGHRADNDTPPARVRIDGRGNAKRRLRGLALWRAVQTSCF